ncbi:MAG: 1,4-alpha-glucan (glycogen) branching enzyme, GH-13-type [Cytophagales bacterium]|jgi:1,4-alpha-glucan branching enzyme|nr:1,4-alpha-glucan branching protein GlgB [Bacteroidota bacterium]MBS1979643.1 1,4-alpha-glucan branching protein GlgB [Bacteroidota bacterium]WHZ09156.1 MAG: 1,4-alpha-glucan (glycogen) branching enzyme, GH-13-type [Cytophagales bacterium]
MKKKKQVEVTKDSYSLLTDFDIHLFRSGKHYQLYEKLGSHEITHNGIRGIYFSVWAPNATAVSVIGNFNHWQNSEHKLSARWDESGIWEGFFANLPSGEAYKYAITSNTGEYLEKADPFARYAEVPPRTASIIWQQPYEWNDHAWLEQRKKITGKSQPYSVYEVHLGSWKRKPEEGNRSLSYCELIHELVPYVKEAGFTHVEFLPVMEHPFFGSWGYQLTGYFAPTSRFGSPQDFMALVDAFHQAGIGVILDWVPSHFPGDAHGLFKFDGTHLYEHADPRKGFHPDWSSYIYNYGRNEVRSFLISNALFWLDQFHIDGLRVDAVASMLYLDYSRKEGEWIANQYGGNENLEAIQFIKEFNETVYANYPDVITIAEESTAWPGVSRPTYLGGLGFGQKWMMGWMHDTLRYFKEDPVYRKYHQNEITFSIMYAFTENFMLPLSHDEVVHGKGSLIGRMPGDDWKKFANLRLMYAYMFTHPGTKLLFMGGEFGQTSEWNHDSSISWHLLEYDPHKGIFKLIQELNNLYKSEKALHHYSFSDKGFEWIDYSDRENSVMVYMRKSDTPNDSLLVICNFTPEVRHQYRIGVPTRGTWKEVFNSDNLAYAGSGVLNPGLLHTSPVKYHNKDYSLSVILPPLAVTVLKLNEEQSEFELES